MTENLVQYTDRARQVLSFAQKRAEMLHHTIIRPEHVLLGLINVPDNQALYILQALNVDLTALTAAVEQSLRPGLASVTAMREAEGARVSLASGTTALLREAALEARDAAGAGGVPAAIDSRLLLLGLLRTPGITASDILAQHGVTLEAARAVAMPAAAVAERPATTGVPVDTRPRVPSRISPTFVLIVLATIVAGALTYVTGSPIGLFVLVLGGWVISLCLHEFGHALVAFIGGDTSVVHNGYLTLDPLRYTHPVLSIVIPLIFLAMGGIGLPGGAVYINVNALRSYWWRSLVSAAGPFATGLFSLALLVPLWLFRGDFTAHPLFWNGFSLLWYLQIVALAINLLPIPGLDGFGIIEPFLPDVIRGLAFSIRQFTFFIFFALFFYPNPVGSAFWLIINTLAVVLHPSGRLSLILIRSGLDAFRFWSGG
jgi:Zn-dependent protease